MEPYFGDNICCTAQNTRIVLILNCGGEIYVFSTKMHETMQIIFFFLGGGCRSGVQTPDSLCIF